MKLLQALVLSYFASVSLARGFTSQEVKSLFARQQVGTQKFGGGGGGGGGNRFGGNNGNGGRPGGGGNSPTKVPPKNGTGNGQTGGGNKGGNNLATSLCIQPDQLFNKGKQNDGTKNASNKFSVASKTSANNFINDCALSHPNVPLADGTQQKVATCNTIPMGIVVGVDKLPSVQITSPPNLGKVPANTDFDVSVKIKNLQVGQFTSAAETYYASPCTVNANGEYLGHTHVAIQKISSFQATENLDPATVAFFLGVDDAADGKQEVKAPVKGGLAPGTYRISTISTCSNHQMFNGPNAKRGSFESMTFIEVVGGGAGNGTAGNSTTPGQNNGGKGSGAPAQGGGKNPAQGGGKAPAQGGGQGGGKAPAQGGGKVSPVKGGGNNNAANGGKGGKGAGGKGGQGAKQPARGGGQGNKGGKGGKRGTGQTNPKLCKKKAKRLAQRALELEAAL